MNNTQFKSLINFDDISILKKLNDFTDHKENLINFFTIYNLFYKYNLDIEKQLLIYPFYKNGIYTIKITKDNEIIFKNEINCNNLEAKLLTELICEDFIKDNEVKLSSIGLLKSTPEYQFTYLDNPDLSSLKIKAINSELITPFYNRLSKFHEMALKKMNDDYQNNKKVLEKKLLD